MVILCAFFKRKEYLGILKGLCVERVLYKLLEFQCLVEKYISLKMNFLGKIELIGIEVREELWKTS